MFTEVIRVATTTSTMDDAAALIRERSPSGAHGCVVVADRQTRGRGRHGRRWLAAREGDLLASFVMHMRSSLLGKVPMLGGLAAGLAVDELASVSSVIKWPNDVLVGGKKVCGVIAESMSQGNGTAAVLGVGMNLAFDPTQAADLRSPAANLNAFTEGLITRDAALEVLSRHVAVLYETVDRGDSGQLFECWRRRLETLGQRVTVSMNVGAGAGGDGALDGIAEDVDASGRLLIRRDDGALEAVSAGDVTVVGRG